MSEQVKRTGNGLLLVALAAVLWGTTGIMGRTLTGTYGVPAITTAAWRLVIAAPCLILWEKMSRKEGDAVKIEKPDRIWFAIYGVAIALYQLCYFSAVNMAPVSVVSIITLCLAPVFVACLAPFILKEPLQKVTIVAIVASIVGTVLVIGLQVPAGGSRTGLGYVLALIAGISYAFYNLCGKKLNHTYRPQFIISRVFTLGAILICPTILQTPALSWDGILCLLYLGIVPSALAYALFQVGLKTCKATSSSVASLMEPLTSTILSVILFNEIFTGSQIAGGLILIGAILLLLRSESRPSSNA